MKIASRNPAVELYRVLLVFCIIFLHAGLRLGPTFCWENIGFTWCVDGFAFISGWFGCRFSVLKLLKLYGVAVFCGFVVELLSRCCGIQTDLNFIQGVWSHVTGKGSWFLHAYAFMMCLAPLVDGALMVNKSFMSIGPLVLLAFGWGYAIEMPKIYVLVPQTSGIGSFTGITLLGVYALARWCRVIDVERFLRVKRLVYSVPILFTLTILGAGWFGHYSSPVCVLLSAAVFFLVKRLHVGDGIGKVLLLLSPSTLSMYLMHSNVSGFMFLDYLGTFFPQGCPLVVTCLVVTVIVFLCTLGLDIPRRLFVRIVQRFSMKSV